MPDNFDLRIGSLRSFDNDSSDGDLEAQGAAGGKGDGARLPIRLGRSGRGAAECDSDDSSVEHVLQQRRAVYFLNSCIDA